MTESEKAEKRENFDAWITFIDDRVDAWKNTAPDDIKNHLNWSAESLQKIEDYLVKNYTLENVGDPQNKATIDALASYIGETIRLNLPESKWKIELSDANDIYFNLPVVKVLIGAPFSPFTLIKNVLYEKAGNLLMDLFERRRKAIDALQQQGK
jgi:hypothetical protein